MISISVGRRASPDASNDATTVLAATVAAHIEQCKTDKQEIKKALADQNNDRKAMHEENQRRLRRLEMVYYFGFAIITVLGFLMTDTGQHLFGTIVHGQLIAGTVP